MGQNNPMPGKRLDLTIKQGVDFDYEFSFDDGNTPAAAIDISDRTFKSQVRADPWSPKLAQFTFQTGNQAQAATKGKVTMKLPWQDTLKMPPGEYSYDIIQIMNSGGGRSELCSGSVTVVRTITRDE